MGLIRLFAGLLLFLLALAVWPVTLVLIIFLALMKVGMKKDFEP